MRAPALDPNEALLVLLFPCATAALCDLSAATRALALASLREAISALPASTVRAPAKNAGLDAAVAALLADAKVTANAAPPSCEDPPTLPTTTAAAVPDIVAFVQRWGRTDGAENATKPHAASTWPKKVPATEAKPELVLPTKPRRPQPLDTMPGAVAGRETFADYRRDASNPVVSPWSLPVFEWSPRKRCCFTVLSFAVTNGTLEMVCSPLTVKGGSKPSTTTGAVPATVSVCGPPITVRCLFDAELHKGRCGAVPVELAGRHVTVWDPYVFITAQGAHEVQVDSLKDMAFHLTGGEIDTFGIRDERDGGFALRWLRKAKADGDALMAEDPAAAARAYTHGLCMCYTRGPLDGDPALFRALFDLSDIIATSFHAVWKLLGMAPQCRPFPAAAQLFFVPDADTAAYREAAAAFDNPIHMMGDWAVNGFPGVADGVRGWDRLPGADVTPESYCKNAISQIEGTPDEKVDQHLRILRSFPLVAEVVDKVAVACEKMRLFDQAFTASVIAALMARPDLADISYGRAAVCAARLNMVIPMRTHVGHYARAVTNTDAVAQRDQVVDILRGTSPWATKSEKKHLNPEVTFSGAFFKTTPEKERRTFCEDRPEVRTVMAAVPFVISSGADVASIRYRNWTLPVEYAGLVRVLQHRSSMPCAALSQQRQRLLPCRDDGVFRHEVIVAVKCPPTSAPFAAPLLFHDLSLPLRGAGYVAGDQQVPEFRFGDFLLFDAARAAEVVGVNGMVTQYPTRMAFIDVGAALCTQKGLPNSVMTVSDMPVVMITPARPLAAGEEITIQQMGRSFQPGSPPKFEELLQRILLRFRSIKGDCRMARQMIMQHAKDHLGWTSRQCAAASKRLFVDFLVDYFGDESPAASSILAALAHDPTVQTALRMDIRLAGVAALINTAHTV